MKNDKNGRRLRFALVGGGPGSFIGSVHRIAAELDREIELVAGAFSSDAARSAEAGAAFRIDPARAYPDLATMLAAETARQLGLPAELEPVTMDQVRLKAPRPRYCALSNAKLAAAGFPMPHWRDALGRWIATRGRPAA